MNTYDPRPGYPFEPWEPSIEKPLVALLDTAANRLSALGSEPALVACCSQRFNDAMYDDEWYAVQIGHSRWERYLDGNWHEVATEPRKPEIAAAREVLENLSAENWDAQLAESRQDFRTGPGSGVVACLAIQHGQAWICAASSITDFGIICTWAPDGRLVRMAGSDRIDDRIGRPWPIQFEQLRPDFWSYLNQAARAHFRPEIRDAGSAKALSALLREADATTARVTDERVLFQASITTHRDWRQSWNEKACVELRLHSTQDRAPLEAILRRFEDADWRGQFGRALGIPVEADEISLIADRQRSLAVWQNTAFDFTAGTLKAVGLCDRWQWWDETFWDTSRPVTLHPID